ncbi:MULTISPECIES: N-acetylglucosamine-6-phosphate deacetylase [unclassified Staphylococcus]|uniref:N-acetylglucosamine-6-phosphate deacetylase n=1 Tax=unclassified Staphylococcus TaxID=91994 RepID=UPI0021D2D824|nr:MULTISPECIES: N-acetylglucosamine-6-phosphate deacetylase [unclassified Staphylococcus]UXR71006.1 N-acetylglucosamine-6-phosphate deacetylase [Staphylococcus sp. IVB6240]UXR75532.1 N-acetylglucosamine-6-phosphate deacetylase [Staphylococcus sp. IVB6233]UXR79734.1 N-acetylglucosamine-6-phosphate deacetylase [Staphylococcus sp. IVB6218]
MTEMYVIQGGSIYTEDGMIEDGHIIVKGNQIHQIKHFPYEGPLEVIDATGQHILPGFIDIHIHGGYGQDVMDASTEGLKVLSEGLLSEGTTSYLATTMTQSEAAIHSALEAVSKYVNQAQDSAKPAAEILGVHLEGPFISEHKVGAQNPVFVQRPSVEQVNDFQKTANGLIKIMTYAPEVEGAEETLKELSNEIIFSMGHTVATFEQANEAVKLGAKHVTHLYNAATPFAHREPGVFGAAWTNPFLHTELIVDGVHAHPAAVDVAYRMKGNQAFYLITDAMRAKGLQDGTYDLGGQDVIVKGKEARLASGALAGSILKMNDGLRNLMDFTGATLEDLWRVTSYNQAKALNILSHKGSLTEGKDADIVIVNDHIDVLTTIKSGYVVNNTDE